MSQNAKLPAAISPANKSDGLISKLRLKIRRLMAHAPVKPPPFTGTKVDPIPVTEPVFVEPPAFRPTFAEPPISEDRTVSMSIPAFDPSPTPTAPIIVTAKRRGGTSPSNPIPPPMILPPKSGVFSLRRAPDQVAQVAPPPLQLPQPAPEESSAVPVDFQMPALEESKNPKKAA